MALVLFTKNAAGPNFGPYLAGDVVDMAASDVTKLATAGSAAVIHPAIIAERNYKSGKRGDSLA
jgi:hypothetical protein